jgi:hypothetical protein
VALAALHREDAAAGADEMAGAGEPFGHGEGGAGDGEVVWREVGAGAVLLVALGKRGEVVEGEVAAQMGEEGVLLVDGLQRASTAPGRPPPEPTSTMRWASPRCGRSARQSAT